MKEIQEQVAKIIELLGFKDFEVESDEEEKHLSVTIRDNLNALNVPDLVADLNRLTRLIGKKLNKGPVIIDINNYRREREKLIVELARAAARKAIATKEPVSLPAMNAYERRLVHAELATRPDVKTESVGEGKNRYVIVKVID